MCAFFVSSGPLYQAKAKSTRNRTFLKLHIRVDEALNSTGERLQNNAVLVTGFTDFVWMKGRFV